MPVPPPLPPLHPPSGGYHTEPARLVDASERSDALADPGLGAWLAARDCQHAAKIRLPLVLGAQRIGLADRRVRELTSQLEETRTRLLNLAGWTDPAVARGLEDRASRLEEELHRERLALWKDLQPLAEQAGDAVIDALRTAWLNELTRTMGGGEDR